MKKLGIIGGMGPLATARLFELIVEMTKSDSDAGHIRTLIDCNPGIPYFFEEIESALGESVEKPLCKKDGFVTEKMPVSEEETAGRVKLINLIEETGRAVLEKGLTRVGVLATRGAVEGKVFEKYLEPMGISVITPDQNGQGTVNSVIYDAVKAGRKLSEELADNFCETCRDLIARGAQALILGCTEIPLAMDAAGLQMLHNCICRSMQLIVA